MSDIFTHKFNWEINIGDNNQYLKGEIEFDTDDKVSYQIKDMSNRISKDSMDLFQRYINLMKDTFDYVHSTNGEIIKISLKTNGE